MRWPDSRTTLARAVVVVAIVAMTTGALSVALGSAIVPGGDGTAASVESELRFYAAWWFGAGLLLLHLAPRLDERVAEFRGVCAVLFVGGVARALGIAHAGAPHWSLLVLMALELLLPPLLVFWHLRTARARRTA